MKHGDPAVTEKCRGTIEERFWPKVDKRGPNDCWPWTAYKNAGGYGTLTVDGIVRPAHRVSHEIHHGPIPEGFQVDHVLERGCTRRDCVNPAHLEAVTPAENTRRAANSASTVNTRKTHCPQGHELTEENIYSSPTGGRRCRKCRTDQKMARMAR